MAGQLVLMESPDGGRMNVPVEKLDEYLAAGWKEISRQPLIVPAPLDLEQAMPEPAAESKPAPKKGKAK
jgi:hypothetical protein